MGRNYKGQFHIDIYGAKENRDFVLSGDWGDNMFYRLNDLYSYRIVPRPYEAILEQHRALVAVNASRIRGASVRLSELNGEDALPYTDAIRRYVIGRSYGKQLNL